VNDQTPAQELRAARDRLRSAVNQIPPNDWDDRPWHLETSSDYDLGTTHLVAQGEHQRPGGPPMPRFECVASAETLEFGRYIALMHPGVGAALADWLDREARGHDATVTAAGRVFADDPAGRDAWIAEQANSEALAVARALLGGTQ
jgi:hypothetical protein